MDDMKIYVGTYAKYNNGSLHGEWIDLEDFDSAEDFYEYCAELHKDDPDPEYMFQDWEGIPDEWIGESWLHPKLWDYIQLDEDKRMRVSIYSEATGATLEEAIEQHEDMHFFQRGEAYDMMTDLFPIVSQIRDCGLNFITVDEDAFLEEYTQVEYDGETYYVETW